jgi:hypothetical protein
MATGDVISMLAQAQSPAARIDDPVLRDPSQDDAARFSQIMGKGLPPDDGIPEVGRLDGPRPASMDSEGLGDGMIRSMDQVGRQFTRQTAEVEAVLAQDLSQLSFPQLLSLQFRLAETSLTADLYSKIIQKGTQHIDQLTKLQ